jgi:CheY-like chemotaxis protein
MPAKRKPNTKKLQGKRILVVEDQPLVSELLTDLLRLYDHPSQAKSGKDALEQIKQRAPDVILLDVNLPDMNGLEVARLVRENEKTSRIPILAMSANPMDKRKCLEMGCNDFIRKPFSASTLLVRLSALIPSRSLTQKCPVIVNRHPCGLQLFRTGTLDESVKPSFDVYECARGHQTYHRSKTNP